MRENETASHRSPPRPRPTPTSKHFKYVDISTEDTFAAMAAVARRPWLHFQTESYQVQVMQSMFAFTHVPKFEVA